MPFHERIPHFLVDRHYIVLKKWYNLNKGLEFRVFCKGG